MHTISIHNPIPKSTASLKHFYIIFISFATVGYEFLVDNTARIFFPISLYARNFGMDISFSLPLSFSLCTQDLHFAASINFLLSIY
jgi:hypothetical protein